MLKRKGFTLLELIIVVIVVAILASLGIPQFVKTVERARASEGAGVLGAVRGAALRYYAEHTAYANTTGTGGIGSLDVTIGTLKNFNAPTVVATAGTNVTLFSIQKSTGTIYTLNIADNGTLSCTGGANCPLGY